ncbi:hypothetical protein BVRB_5g125990 [Beta vulgaris subsp. vulgaris]|uniref:Single-stranded DNA-binding protein n=1 Tax=Beta vulgaris subsp. vulgaris TaxID=3555 RepID=A0A0J8BBZ0_BETVV|nr:single-stranded DNA-binding protein, mitochondrial [Beta vulgaris subsp. vulgaris]KMS97538.1 hypothetical protein BVRB_5g125990 [Beta vulgaris subsp. vulgaris]
MASSNSLAAISRRLYRNLLSNSKNPYFHQQSSKSFFSTEPLTPDSDTLLDELPTLNSESETNESTHDNSAASSSDSFSTPPESPVRRAASEFSLEGGLDIGIYKAILVGQVGQIPVQKRLKNGMVVTLTTLGTGGIKNERVPFPNEEPREYADRCNVQWHRVAIYPEKLGEIVMKHAQPGSLLYLEGNLERKIFTEPLTGLLKRVREIAVRRDGRVVFLGNSSDFNQPSRDELKGVGYF